MGVPIMSEIKPKRIVGDGKKIILRNNSESLLVIGSGNTVTCDNNEGLIKVVGDGCKVCVCKGYGRIEYKGDGGSVETGSDLKNITYDGHGGKIKQLTAKICDNKHFGESFGSKSEDKTFEIPTSSKRIRRIDVNGSKCVNIINTNNCQISMSKNKVFHPSPLDSRLESKNKK